MSQKSLFIFKPVGQHSIAVEVFFRFDKIVNWFYHVGDRWFTGAHHDKMIQDVILEHREGSAQKEVKKSVRRKDLCLLSSQQGDIPLPPIDWQVAEYKSPFSKRNTVRINKKGADPI